MAKTPRFLPDIIIASLLAALALAAVISWPLSEPSAAPDNDADFTPDIRDQAASAVKRPSASLVAGLFGYRAPVRVRPPAATRVPAVTRTPDQLKYFGSVTTAKGTAYSFKNTRTGQVLTLYPGRANSQGWKLTSIDIVSYTIEHQGTVYTVPR